MRRTATRTLLLFCWSLLLLVAGCEKPKPPTLKPESALVKKVHAAGVDIDLTIDAQNPNKVPLFARKITATVKLDDSIDLGEVVVDTKVKIDPESNGKITAPLSLKWGDVKAVAMLATQKEVIPFTVEGTAEVGVERAHFDVPFKTQGTLTRQELMTLGVNALPFQIPTGLPLPL